MSRKNKNKARAGGGQNAKANPGAPGREAAGGQGEDEKVKTSGWSDDQPRPRWKDFAGVGADERLRVNFSPTAYADLVAHAKEDLSAEVCGVLAGEFREDEHGLHVAVEAAVRGASAKAGAAHLTYTQETWTKIHEEMEARHPSLRIVGWYHSHPGFGVEFSDMDLFIQKNFFSGRGQVALVTDPLGGEEAMCFNGSDGIEHIGRFWVDGRARQCQLPASQGADERESDGGSAGLRKAVESVEERLGQALRAVEDLRTSYYRFLTVVGMLIAVGILYYIGSDIYRRFVLEANSPRISNLKPGPVRVKTENGDWVWITPIFVAERVSLEQEAALKESERQAYEAAKAQEQKKAAATGSAAQTRPASGALPAAASEEGKGQ